MVSPASVVVVVVVEFLNVALNRLGRLVGVVGPFGSLGDLVHEVVRLHGHACGGIQWRGVDLVVDFEPCHRNDFGSRRAASFGLSRPLPFMATAPTSATPAAASSSRVVLGGLGRGCAALLFGLSLEQGLPVRDRDLVVVGMNFGKS